MRDRRSMTLSASSTVTGESTWPSVSGPTQNEKQLSGLPSYSPIPPPVITKENYAKRDGRAGFMWSMRIIVFVCSIFALHRIVLLQTVTPGSFRISDAKVSHTVGNTSQEGPTILRVSDDRDQSRWTVHIPHNYSFPLQNDHVREICSQGDSLRDSLSQQSGLLRAKDWRRQSSYYSSDKTFLEIGEAERAGLLAPGRESGSTCDRSLTLALDEEDSSFGKSLLMLWLSYGLAKKENRAFFIDDTRWAYGQYTSFFAPPPPPNCARPPSHHVVPCPHSARHLLVSSATLRWTFGSSFEREYMQAREAGIGKNRRIFDLLRRGYNDLFRLTGEHALYAASRIAKFRDEADRLESSVVGIHLRRGDLHPFEHQFGQDYLPLERYALATHELLHAELHNAHLNAHEVQMVSDNVYSPLLLASDDPEMFNSAELMQGVAPYVIQRVQERILLATKSTLDRNSPAEPQREPGSVYMKFVDENAGWEGGFFQAVFYSLGKEKKTSGDSIVRNQRSSDEVKEMRSLVGQAYVLDLAILGESDRIVCAISSATCRLLAVMLGWDAVKEGHWVNIDDQREWSWDGRR